MDEPLKMSKQKVAQKASTRRNNIKNEQIKTLTTSLNSPSNVELDVEPGRHEADEEEKEEKKMPEQKADEEKMLMLEVASERTKRTSYFKGKKKKHEDLVVKF
uniref:GK21892 n=1 Tax=Drosophila willistoni TaxID=7260 RepID=B4MQK4_DROWI